MKDISWTACLRFGATAAGVYLICAGHDTLRTLIGATTPLLLGGGAACIVNMPMTALERRFFPHGGYLARALCLTASLIGTAAAGLWLAGVILPEVAQCALLLAGELPELLGGAAAWLEAQGALAWLKAAGLPDWQTLLQHGLAMAQENAGQLLQGAAEGLMTLTSGAANALLALILAAYMLAAKERLRAQAERLSRRFLSEGGYNRLARGAAALHGAFCTYVKSQCVEALVLGGLCLTGMLLLRLPQALTISALAGASALIPLAGAPIAAAAGAALLLPHGAAQAMTFAVFFLILQQVESSLISPHIVGTSLGLPPLWTLAAMIVGGGLLGLPGAVLAVPVAAAARQLLMESV